MTTADADLDALRRAVAVARADRPRPGHRRLPAVRLVARPSSPAGTGSSRRRWTATLDRRDRRQRQPVRLVGRPGGRRRRGHRQPLRLGAARRRLRRSARHRLGAARRRPAARAGRHARAGRSPSPPSPRRRASRFGVACLGSRLLTGALDPDRARGAERPRRGHAGRAMADAGPTRTSWAPTRTGSAGSARSSSCTSSRAAALATRAGRGGQRDLAARPVAARLHRRGQPRRHHPDGRPARPDADLRLHRARRQQGGPAGRRARHVGRVAVEPNATNAIPSRVTRLARRPGRRSGHTGRAGRRRSRHGRPSGPGGTAPQVDDDRRVGLAGGRLRRRAARPARRSCSARRRSCRPAPGTTPACWPRQRADRDAVRAQPDRRLARPGRARHRRRLRRRAWPRSPTVLEELAVPVTWPTGPSTPGCGGPDVGDAAVDATC